MESWLTRRISTDGRAGLIFLLDTNVISEPRKVKAGRADAGVAAWAQAVETGSLFMSSISVHELELGVRLMEHRDFEGRILPVDTAWWWRPAT